MNVFRGKDRSWTEQYALIGEFVVEFEGAIDKIRFAASSLLQHYGLEKWAIAEIIFNQPSFAAWPLFECYAQIVGEVLPDAEEVQKEVAAFSKRFQPLCERRNRLLHGTHLYGPDTAEITDQGVPQEMIILHRRPSRRGRNAHPVVAETMDTVRNDITEAREVKQLAMALFSKVMGALYNQNPDRY